MRVLITGATGLIGGAVARHLAGGGHEVTGLARSDVSAAELERRGYRVARGDLADGAAVASAAAGADAVIHAGSPGDASMGSVDYTAVQAILGALRGSGRRFLYTSGCLLYGDTGDGPATEETPLLPLELVRFRKTLEGEVLNAASLGVHSVVIRPGWVYGDNGGTAMMMWASARTEGVARHVGDGRNRWTSVHADDLAELYDLALQHAPTGSVFNGCSGAPVLLRDLAEAASVGAGAGGRTAVWPLEDARRALGGFADAIACDQVVSGELAQRELGWRPTRRSIVDELRTASTHAA